MPEIEDSVKIIYTCRGGDVLIDSNHDRCVILIPTMKSFVLEVSIINNDEINRVDTISFFSVEPPSPDIVLSVDGNTRPDKCIRPTSVVYVELKPNVEFASLYPNETVYQIYNLQLKTKTIGMIKLRGHLYSSEKSTRPRIVFNVPTDLDLNINGLLLALEIEKVYRINSFGEVFEEPFSNLERTGMYFIEY